MTESEEVALAAAEMLAKLDNLEVGDVIALSVPVRIPAIEDVPKEESR